MKRDVDCTFSAKPEDRARRALVPHLERLTKKPLPGSCLTHTARLEMILLRIDGT